MKEKIKQLEECLVLKCTEIFNLREKLDIEEKDKEEIKNVC